MPEISPELYVALCHVRAALRTNALHRTWNGKPNQGIAPADLAREAASLRTLVEARLNIQRHQNGEAVCRPVPLTALTREYPMAIAGLAEAVAGGEITSEGIEAFMTSSEFTRAPRPLIPAQAPAPAAEVLPGLVGELERV